MSAQFDVVDLDDGWTRGAREPGGDERKRWFRAPDSSPHAGHWLFKPRTEKPLTLSKVRQARGDSPDVLISGEDWAEKISYELALLLNLPAVETELATATPPGEQRVWGSMSRDMRPKVPESKRSQRWPSSAGASLLAEVDPAFDANTCVGHTLDAVCDVLTRAKVVGPVGTEYAEWSAFDVWAGYLMLDAWIANTDRHAHNWGVVQDPTSGATYLGPTYDHGTALAAGETERKRADRVKGDSVAQWCDRGGTFRFYGGKWRALVDLAVEALSLCSPDARTHWVSQITAVDLGVCDSVTSRIPNMSDPTRTFVNTVITTNRKRLCDALH
ncbi:hypothetical protein K8O93_06780 [Gordonia bronchialis]|uniref:hypothetical protein n=1 Tax=Gordonia bronchialis TaxID=2054 RepID=UPI001CC024CE|nr:hypothetical protein [Gordonia bronchialis]UAK39378.1 hypothetical protein K8O93_06780 [Gordonia bronchialis]